MPLDPPLPCPCPSLATASAYPCTSLPLPPSSFSFSLCFSRCPREHLASFFGVNFTTPVHSFNCHSSHMHTTPPPSYSSPLSVTVAVLVSPFIGVTFCRMLHRFQCHFVNLLFRVPNQSQSPYEDIDEKNESSPSRRVNTLTLIGTGFKLVR